MLIPGIPPEAPPSASEMLCEKVREAISAERLPGAALGRALHYGVVEARANAAIPVGRVVAVSSEGAVVAMGGVPNPGQAPVDVVVPPATVTLPGWIKELECKFSTADLDQADRTLTGRRGGRGVYLDVGGERDTPPPCELAVRRAYALARTFRHSWAKPLPEKAWELVTRLRAEGIGEYACAARVLELRDVARRCNDSTYGGKLRGPRDHFEACVVNRASQNARVPGAANMRVFSYCPPKCFIQARDRSDELWRLSWSISVLTGNVELRLRIPSRPGSPPRIVATATILDPIAVHRLTVTALSMGDAKPMKHALEALRAFHLIPPLLFATEDDT